MLFGDWNNTDNQDPLLHGLIPLDGSAGLSGRAMDPEDYQAYFEKVDFAGAFRSSDSAWHYRWAEFLHE